MANEISPCSRSDASRLYCISDPVSKDDGALSENIPHGKEVNANQNHAT